MPQASVVPTVAHSPVKRPEDSASQKTEDLSGDTHGCQSGDQPHIGGDAARPLSTDVAVHPCFGNGVAQIIMTEQRIKRARQQHGGAQFQSGSGTGIHGFSLRNQRRMATSA